MIPLEITFSATNRHLSEQFCWYLENECIGMDDVNIMKSERDSSEWKKIIWYF